MRGQKSLLCGMTRDKLISRIESYAKRHGIAPATVTSRAVGNSRLYHRLKAGGGCTIDVAERIWAYTAPNGNGHIAPENTAA